MAIDAQHKDYKDNIDNWNFINDIINEKNLENHVLTINEHDNSEQNIKRNSMYKKRAAMAFIPLAAQTLSGIVGSLFTKQPTFDRSTSLDYLAENCDGSGNSIFQQAQMLGRNVSAISRSALYTSFPKFDREITQADINKGIAVASIQEITADRVINWRYKNVGALSVLELVVFTDTISTIEDYETKEQEALRELYLDEHIYKERIWVKSDDVKLKDKWIVHSEVTPTQKNGLPLEEIPFSFVGATNNDGKVDVPNMLGLSRLNVALLGNIADFEDNVYYLGQSQYWMSGVTQLHLDMMKKEKLYTGSRDLMLVPEGGSFGCVGAPPNPLVRQAKLDKIDEMVSVGARIIKLGTASKSVEQTIQERENQHSTMTLIADNITDAYKAHLDFVGLFMGVENPGSFILDKEFITQQRTTQELKEVITGFMGSTIPTADYVAYMKKYGLFDADKEDGDYIEELDNIAVEEMPDMGGV